MSTLYSIVVPVYNSERSLREIVVKANELFSSYADRDCEILFVNDGSSNPATAPMLSKLVEENSNVRVTTLTKNFGQQPATLCGIAEAKGEYIITMDDDMQHDPDDIAKLIDCQEHDIVFARFGRKKHTVRQRFFSAIKSHFDYLLIGKPKHISLSSFRLFNRLVADAVLQIRTPYPFIPAQLFLVSKDIVNVDIEHHERMEGKTNYNFWSMLSLFSNLMINNSSFLLSILGKIGLAASFGSVCLMVYIVLDKLSGEYVLSGWTSMMASMLFIGGLLLFAVGIIGEYLIRIIANGENVPCYVVRKIERND